MLSHARQAGRHEWWAAGRGPSRAAFLHQLLRPVGSLMHLKIGNQLGKPLAAAPGIQHCLKTSRRGAGAATGRLQQRRHDPDGLIAAHCSSEHLVCSLVRSLHMLVAQTGVEGHVRWTCCCEKTTTLLQLGSWRKAWRQPSAAGSCQPLVVGPHREQRGFAKSFWHLNRLRLSGSQCADGIPANSMRMGQCAGEHFTNMPAPCLQMR